MWIPKIIKKIESIKLNFAQLALTFGALIIVRVLLEGFAYKKFILPSWADLFLLSPLYYINVLISIALVVLWLTKTNWRKLGGVFLAGFIIAFINPLLHIITAQKLTYPSLVVTSQDLVQKLFTFLFSSSQFDLTIAAKIQVILFIVFVTVYVFVKTKSIFKTVIGAIVTYLVGFFYSAPTFIVAIFAIWWQKGIWDVSLLEIIDLFNDPPGFILIRYSEQNVYSAVLSSVIFIVLLLLQLWIFAMIVNRKKIKALWQSIRPTRLIVQVFLFGTGCFYAFTRLGNKNIFTFDFISMVIMAALATIGAWLFSVLLNDIVDRRIDKISNPHRPLSTGLLNIKEINNLAIITGAITLVSALTLGFTLFFLYLVMLALAYVYSFPPVRLKKWPIISQVTLAGSGTILFTIGYLLFNANNTITNLPTNLLVLIFVCTALLASIKDLKDYAGDKIGKIYTIPTIFGEKKGKLIIAIMSFVALMLFPILLKSPDLIFISLSFGIANMLLIMDKKVREKWIFGLIFIYIVLVYLIAF